MLKKIFVILNVLIFSFIIWNAFSLYQIWTFGQTQHHQKADAIIVLGAAAWYTEPSPVFKERINHGIELYKQGFAPLVIFTGGYGGTTSEPAESQVALSYATEQGIPESNILIETDSQTTQQNLLKAKELMLQKNLTTAIIVSDPLHMKRAMLYAHDIGITAYSSPTPTSRFQSLETQREFLIRELYFYQTYQIYRLLKPISPYIPYLNQALSSLPLQ